MAERSPLFPLHREAGASLGEVLGWEVPLSFGDPEGEYRALAQGAGLWDRCPWGRLRLTGPDALDLLNRLTTNRVDTLPPGRGAPTALTSPKGKVLDLLSLFALEGFSLLLTSPSRQGAVAEWIERYTIVEDVSTEDITPETGMVAVLGPRAGEVVRAALGTGEGLPPWGCRALSWRGRDLFLLRPDALGLPQYDLIAPAEALPALWEALRGAGARPAGEEALEALRVERGIPRWGYDFGEDNNPLEAGLEGAVSFTKGCYIGQEVVARLKTYQKVRRYLVGLSFPGEALPRGARLRAEGQEAGVLTSTARLPSWRETKALGYLRTPFVREGREVEAVTPQGKSIPGVVVRAPEVPAEALTPAKLLELLAEEGEEG